MGGRCVERFAETKTGSHLPYREVRPILSPNEIRGSLSIDRSLIL
jgi:hypothetical protein